MELILSVIMLTKTFVIQLLFGFPVDSSFVKVKRHDLVVRVTSRHV